MTDLQFVHALADELYKTHKANVYFVGGYVRDKLCSIPNDDIDIEIHGVAPDQLNEVLRQFGDVITFGKSFGIIQVTSFNVDIALPRTEVKVGNNHTDFKIAVDPFLGTLKASRRRDFTINALMENVRTGEIIDHFDGLSHLQDKILHHVDDKTFVEDNLRVLRGCGFASRLGFTIHPDTGAIMRTMDISILPRERVFKELSKVLLSSPDPMSFFAHLDDLGLLGVWFPEVQALIAVRQNPEHHPEGNVFMHTALVLRKASALFRGELEIEPDVQVMHPLAFMLSALCHDFGKISHTTIEIIDGQEIIRSIGHETDTSFVETFLRRLTNEKDLINLVVSNCRGHMSPRHYINSKYEAKPKKLMYFWDIIICPNDLILLSWCDSMGRETDTNATPTLIKHLASLQRYNDLMAKPQVTGEDLIKAGAKPSSVFAEMLSLARRLHLAGTSKENALRQVKGHFKSEFGIKPKIKNKK